MRRVHLIVGLLGVVAFLITGQLMSHHSPPVRALTLDVHMMYIPATSTSWARPL